MAQHRLTTRRCGTTATGSAIHPANPLVKGTD